MNGIGERLNILRKERELSLDEISDALKIAKSSLSRYENNQSVPSIEAVKDIAKYFNVSIDYLTGGTDIREVNKSTNVDNEITKLIDECKNNNIPMEKLKMLIELLKENK
ncbi:helix-turn-helix domain-containing protein [Lachnoclostridium sp.]|uniref:helix-turn-helix domain-containing protein n=1 Tax=Lachnoclostridium sp. TaxID=2028282 RepID=UPI0028972379|nr:helix-turn-helix transcriptional regulator [Lachnoclostridium sp.]